MCSRRIILATRKIICVRNSQRAVPTRARIIIIVVVVMFRGPTCGAIFPIEWIYENIMTDVNVRRKDSGLRRKIN